VIAQAPGWALGVALLAAVSGIPLRRVLQRLSYRAESESGAEHPGSRWWVPPVLGGLGWLLVTRVGQEATLTAPAQAVLLITLLLVAFGCVALAAIDLDVHRLPDRLLAPCGGVLLTGLSLVSLLGAGAGPWWRALLCALASGIFYLLLASLSLARGSVAVGLGDVKLSLLLGAALGWFGVGNTVVGVYAGFVAGGVMALALLFTRQVSLRGHVAYGPPMMAGALVGIMLPAGSVASLF